MSIRCPWTECTIADLDKILPAPKQLCSGACCLWNGTDRRILGLEASKHAILRHELSVGIAREFGRPRKSLQIVVGRANPPANVFESLFGNEDIDLPALLTTDFSARVENARAQEIARPFAVAMLDANLRKQELRSFDHVKPV